MDRPYRYADEEPYRLDPTPLYATLRREQPVAAVSTPYGEPGWLVTRYDSVKTVLSDPRFSRAGAVAAGDRLPRASSFAPLANPLSSTDPPEHTRVRRPVLGAFTKNQVERYRRRTREIADTLVDDLLAAGGPVDLCDAFAKPLPTTLVGEIFGVPPQDRVQFKQWSTPVLSRTRHTSGQIAAAQARLHGYLHRLVTRKRAHPGDDLLSDLLRTHAGQHTITEDQLVAITASLLLNDSIANQTANFCYQLLTNPEQLAWLRSHPARLPAAVEELLRYVPVGVDAPSGAQGHPRMALTDVHLDGTTIRAGDFVLPSIVSANRDERVFADAYRLDLSRTRNPHIAFGYGTHHCPGAELSRMTLQVALGTLLRRLPDLQLAVPPDQVPWIHGMIVRGLHSLPVRW
ncbi:MAG TPA: cytochrome P450 [Rugosimonospora sp.]|nr:cytochrome P450 [Rugosimonospora sp.]